MGVLWDGGGGGGGPNPPPCPSRGGGTILGPWVTVCLAPLVLSSHRCPTLVQVINSSKLCNYLGVRPY